VETIVMQVRLLGPVDVIVSGEPRELHGVRRKTVLATLALHHGEVVSIGRLADIVWGARAPSTARNTLQSHVSYLRQVMDSKTAIRARPPGYVLDLGDGTGDGTDVQHAERLLRQGQRSADPAQGAQYLEAALALWRGRPLADLAGQPWLEEQAEHLDLLRVGIRRALSEARLAAGDHLALVPELERMAAGRPLDEQIQAQLMLALYRSGRQADALAVHQRLRRALAEELGVDPSQSLRDLEAAILYQDPALDLPVLAAGLARHALRSPVPAQLPPVPSFAGRRAELASLDALLRETPHGSPGRPAGVAISVLSGTAGVGKTTLALHWAQRVSARFPDGQLFANLQGFDPAGEVLEPSDALRGFLEAFGVPAARIPPDLPAQAALYRSVLAGKRVLVVLDNARDARQVRALLPGSPGCAAIVTSRNHLAGLVAAEGAYPLTLDLLSTADARDLLARRLGPARLTREPAAVAAIIAGCARLPLALTVAAARAATAPHFPLAAIATELREASRALDPFRSGDSATDVRSVFSWSYRALSPETARLFRLLGLHAGPDFSLAIAASLAAVAPERARDLLAELARAHLVAEHAPGRYAFHDLLRAYASEQVLAHDGQQVRDAAVRRVLDCYLHTAYLAAVLIDPHMEPLALVPARPGVVLGAPATADAAMSWFTAEREGILAAVRLAAGAGLSSHAWQLAWTVSTFYLRRGAWADNALAQQAALAAAIRAGEVSGEGHAVHGLALGYARSGRFGDAVPYFERALSLFDSVSDQVSQARIHNSLTWIAEHEERLADALEHAAQALKLYRAAGHRPGQAVILNDIGFCHARLGDFQPALAYCEQGLAAVREVGDRNGEAAALDSLGYIHHGLGDPERAVACYEQAIGIYRELADRFNEADTLVSLGDLRFRAGDTGAARRTWANALAIFDEIGHPGGDEVRAKLDGIGRQPDAGGGGRESAAPPVV
jgi:DNA-binding SARP family transcriptional activator/tetratricopeptide (TPR) repeat protein